MPMMALVNPVYDCLFRLAQPDSLRREEEVGAGKRRMAADAPLVLRGTSKKRGAGRAASPVRVGGTRRQEVRSPGGSRMEVLVVAPGRTPSLGAALSPETQQPGVPRGRAARCHARSPPSHEGTVAVEPPVSADPRCLSSGAGRRALGQQLPG